MQLWSTFLRSDFREVENFFSLVFDGWQNNWNTLVVIFNSSSKSNDEPSEKFIVSMLVWWSIQNVLSSFHFFSKTKTIIIDSNRLKNFSIDRKRWIELDERWQNIYQLILFSAHSLLALSLSLSLWLKLNATLLTGKVFWYASSIYTKSLYVSSFHSPVTKTKSLRT